MIVDDGASYPIDIVSGLLKMWSQHETGRAQVPLKRLSSVSSRLSVSPFYVAGAGPAAFPVDDDQVELRHPDNRRIGLQLDLRQSGGGVLGRPKLRSRRIFRDVRVLHFPRKMLLKDLSHGMRAKPASYAASEATVDLRG